MIDVAYICKQIPILRLTVIHYVSSQFTKKLTKNKKEEFGSTYNLYLSRTGDVVASTEAFLYLNILNKDYFSESFNELYSKLIFKGKEPSLAYRLMLSYIKLSDKLHNRMERNVLFRRLSKTEDPKLEKKYIGFYLNFDEYTEKQLFAAINCVDRIYEYIETFCQETSSCTFILEIEKLINSLKEMNLEKPYIKCFIKAIFRTGYNFSKYIDLLFEMKELVTYPFLKVICNSMFKTDKGYDFIKTSIYSEYEAGIYDARLSPIEKRIKDHSIIVDHRRSLYKQYISKEPSPMRAKAPVASNMQFESEDNSDSDSDSAADD